VANISTTEAARRLGTSRQNVLRMCDDGRINAHYDKAPGLKRGRWRVPEEEVERLKREADDSE
jgi:excisionase family DNA binding protein